MIAFRSYLFTALFYLWSTIFSLSIMPLFLCPRRWTVRALSVWGWGCIQLLRLVCDIKVEVRGREHIPAGRAIIAPKHQCMFDVFAQFAWLDDVCFVMKQELGKIPFFGWYAHKGGMIAVDRGGHSAALKKLVRDAQDRMKAPRQLLIFPEGTRREPGAPGDYKPGIAALYRELDLPVHPMATNSGLHWPAHGFIRKPGTIVFEYLEPIPPGLKRAEFMRTLEDRIEGAQKRLPGLSGGG
jgi:1-acyl-sn-glycerol-3-phosphate acyltransferase